MCASLCQSDFGSDIVYAIEYHIVPIALELLHPFIIDFGLYFFNAGIELREDVHFDAA